MLLARKIEIIKEQLMEDRTDFYKTAPFPQQYYLAAERIVRFQLLSQVEILEKKIKDFPKLFNLTNDECLNRGRSIGISIAIVELKKELKFVNSQLKQINKTNNDANKTSSL